MRKKLKSALTLLSFGLISTLAFGATSDHLLALKSGFPYGLLGDDYGILTVNDLALNACHIKPEPFVPGALNPYEYWQCFESKAISLACENVSVLDEDGAAGRIVVKADADRTTHRFIESRPWPHQECRRFVKSLKKLMKGTSHACISASYIGHEEENELGKKERIGILNRFKTRKGCEGEECEFTDKVKKDYCPDLIT